MDKKKSVDIKHLSNLSNIPVSKEEITTYEHQFLETLDVIAQLEELDTSKVVTTPQVTGQTNRFREDRIDKSRLLTQKQALSNAKSKHKGYFLVDAILEQS